MFDKRSVRSSLIMLLVFGGCGEINPMLCDNDSDGEGRLFEGAAKNPNVYPGAPEVCRDGFVNDCEADDVAAALAQCSVLTPDDACVTIDGFNAPIAHSVNVAGDINGDGHADLYVITAAPDSEGVMWPNTAHFLLGPFTRGETVTLADAVWRVSVPSADQRLYVRPAADLLDDDGREELFFMVHDNNYCLDGDCSVYVLGLNDRPVASLDNRADHARLSFTAQGILTATGSTPVDYDGDGFRDVLLGQQTHAGAWNYDRFFLFSGPQEGQALTTADAKLVFTPPQHNSGLGYNSGTLDDLDGDDLPELFLAAPGYDITTRVDTGAGFIYSGVGAGEVKVDESSALATFYGEPTGNMTCRPGGSAGDLDGDGLEELYCVSPFSDRGAPRAGGVYLINGAGAAWNTQQFADADIYFQGEAENDYAGRDFIPLGDFNHDGSPDVLTLARDRNVGGFTIAGVAYLSFGPLMPHEGGVYDLGRADVRIEGAETDAQLGRWGVAAALLDDDAHPDVLLTSWSASEGKGYGHIFCGGSVY